MVGRDTPAFDLAGNPIALMMIPVPEWKYYDAVIRERRFTLAMTAVVAVAGGAERKTAGPPVLPAASVSIGVKLTLLAIGQVTNTPLFPEERLITYALLINDPLWWLF